MAGLLCSAPRGSRGCCGVLSRARVLMVLSGTVRGRRRSFVPTRPGCGRGTGLDMLQAGADDKRFWGGDEAAVGQGGRQEVLVDAAAGLVVHQRAPEDGPGADSAGAGLGLQRGVAARSRSSSRGSASRLPGCWASRSNDTDWLARDTNLLPWQARTMSTHGPPEPPPIAIARRWSCP